MLLALKLKLFAVIAAAASPLAVAPLLPAPPVATLAPATVDIAAGTLRYRASGEFTRAGRPVTAPSRTVAIPAPLAIMRAQVSVGEYGRCVAAGACKPLPASVANAADRPAVQVSWRDAERYAAWLSQATGVHYRLPTDEEWAHAAGSRWQDDGDVIDASDPSRRALARYDRESALKAETEESEPQPTGRFGANEHGLVDLSGNVWEWTASCYVRTALDASDDATATTTNCGVRVVEGRHRAYVTDFIRDARAGGCAAGVPPSYLGFRLVREPQSWRGWALAKLDTTREWVASLRGE